MGQKTHPLGFRLGIVKDWKSRWYAERDFPRLLQEDETIRGYLHRRLAHAALSKVEIERKPSKVVVTLFTARPGVVIGKRGAEVDKLRDELGVLTKAEISVNVEDIRARQVDARPVRESVALQLRQWPSSTRPLPAPANLPTSPKPNPTSPASQALRGTPIPAPIQKKRHTGSCHPKTPRRPTDDIPKTPRQNAQNDPGRLNSALTLGIPPGRIRTEGGLEA